MSHDENQLCPLDEESQTEESSLSSSTTSVSCCWAVLLLFHLIPAKNCNCANTLAYGSKEQYWLASHTGKIIQVTLKSVPLQKEVS